MVFGLGTVAGARIQTSGASMDPPGRARNFDVCQSGKGRVQVLSRLLRLVHGNARLGLKG
jgi:hypothetical protein